MSSGSDGVVTFCIFINDCFPIWMKNENTLIPRTRLVGCQRNCKTIKLNTSPTPIIKQVIGSMMNELDVDSVGGLLDFPCSTWKNEKLGI
jgi:hypothetical protein